MLYRAAKMYVYRVLVHIVYIHTTYKAAGNTQIPCHKICSGYGAQTIWFQETEAKNLVRAVIEKYAIFLKIQLKT